MLIYRRSSTALALSASISIGAALLPTTAHSADGVVEINQTCAVHTGCVPGDAPGFPVTLVASNSYRLTSHLLVGDLDETAVSVKADDVTLDLAGFTIRNADDCRPDCGVTGAGDGIDATGRENLSVRDGTILGMGRSAVRGGDLTMIEGLRAIGQGGSAIVVGDRSDVRNSLVQGAGGVGVAVGHESAVANTVVRSAGDDGIRAGTSFLATRVRVVGNGGVGIDLQSDSGVVLDSIVSNNALQGIFAADAVVSRNLIAGNQGAAVYLLEGSGGVVRDNHVRDNASGIDVATPQGTIVHANSITGTIGTPMLTNGTDGITGNVLSLNPGAGATGVLGGGVDVGANVCSGATPCP